MIYATATGVRETHVGVALGQDPAEPATLSFDNGLEQYRLSADAGLTSLMEARFGEPAPVVWATNHDIHVDYPLGSRMLRRVRDSDIRLNPATSWALEIHSGTAHLDADLRGLLLRTVSFHAGVAHSTLTLPPASGQCVIRVGSVKELRITRPAGTAVRLEVAKGATNVRLDGRRFGAVGGGLADETGGYPEAPDRYLIIASGGVDTLTVDS